MSLASIVADVQANWFLYLSMPFVAAIIGFVTKIIAIEMMFQPLEFVGLEKKVFGYRVFGWQGIVPRRAAIMASIACDTMTTKLLKPTDIFGRLDPARVAREIQEPMLAAVEDITREVASHYQPGLWEAMPESMRSLIIERLKKESPAIVQQLATRGVRVRDRSAEPGCEDCIRITAGIVDDTRRAIAALEEVLCAAR